MSSFLNKPRPLFLQSQVKMFYKYLATTHMLFKFENENSNKIQL